MPAISKTSFSLATLLLVTALIASLVSNYLLRCERESLLTSNAAMARELQIFDIVDKDKVHAVKLREPCKMVWRFRVYIPPGKHVQLRCSNDVPDESGFAKPWNWSNDFIEGSDELQTITIQIRRCEDKRLEIFEYRNQQFDGGTEFHDLGFYDWIAMVDGGPLPQSQPTNVIVQDWDSRVLLWKNRRMTSSQFLSE